MTVPHPPRLHFATQLYTPSREVDRIRLLAGIETNLQLPFITQATIFLDDCAAPWQQPQVRFVRLQRRATYADFLELLAGEDAEPADAWTHLLFANSDIIFDEEIAHVAAAVSCPDWAICLTRRELDGTYPAGIDPLQSQDAWLLARQQPDPLLLDQLRGVRLGVAGCEHLYAAALVAHGFTLWNPCEGCRATHTDPDPVPYPPACERYWGLYAYVPPCQIEAIGRSDPEVYFAYAHAPGHYYPVRIA
jgi:hypothetical protein